jgi:hypothetical protein
MFGYSKELVVAPHLRQYSPDTVGRLVLSRSDLVVALKLGLWSSSFSMVLSSDSLLAKSIFSSSRGGGGGVLLLCGVLVGSKNCGGLIVCRHFHLFNKCKVQNF